MSFSNVFNTLSHALRRLPEDIIRSGELLRIDPNEAIENCEEALDGVLNKIYAMHDVAKKHKMNWYKVPEIAVLLKVRNERQHAGRHEFQTALRHIADNAHRVNKHGYTCLDFQYEEMNMLPLYVTLHPFVDIVQRENKRYPGGASQLIDYTHVRQWVDQSAKIAFFDFFPLITNAMIPIVACARHLIKPLSVESDTYLSHFQITAPYDLSKCKVTTHPPL